MKIPPLANGRMTNRRRIPKSRAKKKPNAARFLTSSACHADALYALTLPRQQNLWVNSS